MGSRLPPADTMGQVNIRRHGANSALTRQRQKAKSIVRMTAAPTPMKSAFSSTNSSTKRFMESERRR